MLFSSSKICADIPLEKLTPSWGPFPSVLGYLAGAVLLAAGIGLALNKKSRIAATSIGALMTVVTLFLYLPILVLALIGSAPEINEALNYLAGTLLYAGAALALASALPRDGKKARPNKASYLTASALGFFKIPPTPRGKCSTLR